MIARDGKKLHLVVSAFLALVAVVALEDQPNKLNREFSGDELVVLSKTRFDTRHLPLDEKCSIFEEKLRNILAEIGSELNRVELFREVKELLSPRKFLSNQLQDCIESADGRSAETVKKSNAEEDEQQIQSSADNQVRELQAKLTQTQTKLEQTQAELEDLQAKLSEANDKLSKVKESEASELEYLGKKLEQMKQLYTAEAAEEKESGSAELAKMRANLAQVRELYEQAAQREKQTKNKLDATVAKVELLENSLRESAKIREEYDAKNNALVLDSCRRVGKLQKHMNMRSDLSSRCRKYHKLLTQKAGTSTRKSILSIAQGEVVARNIAEEDAKFFEVLKNGLEFVRARCKHHLFFTATFTDLDACVRAEPCRGQRVDLMGLDGRMYVKCLRRGEQMTPAEMLGAAAYAAYRTRAPIK